MPTLPGPSGPCPVLANLGPGATMRLDSPRIRLHHDVTGSDDDLLSAQPLEVGMPRSRRRRVPSSRRAAVTLLVLGVAAGLGGLIERSVATTADATSPTSRSGAISAATQTRCWTDEVRREIPRGATVYVGPNTFESQLAAESVTLWAQLVPTRQAARWTLALESAPGPCGGLNMVAART